MQPKSINWVEKYRPQTLSQIVGHPTAVEELRRWAQSWLHGVPKDRAITLYGRAGTGKTSSVYALANDMKWEITELNASDQRTAAIIEKIVGSGSQMQTISGAKRLIILDEADNIHGTADRGGEKAIIGLIKKTNHPIVLIANELYDMSFALRSSCRLIQFRSVSASSIISVLRKIVNIEKIICGAGVIEKIADNADGDLGGAINDLQAIAQGRSKIELKDITTGERDTRENIFKVLGEIFKGTDILNAYRATFNLDENPEDFIQWIDENLPYEYIRPSDRDEAYNYLSRASLFLGRVRKRQNYTMWRYASVLMTSGIVVARSQKYPGFIKFQTPTIRKRLAETRSTRKIRDSLAKKIGTHCHASIGFTRQYLFPFFKLMIKNEKYAPSIIASLRLEPEEIAFITDSKSDTKHVQKLYDESQSIIKEDTEHGIELFGRFSEYSTSADEDDNKDKGTKKSQSSLFDF